MSAVDRAAERPGGIVGEARWPMAGVVLAAMVLTYVALGAGLLTTIAWLLTDRSGDFVAERLRQVLARSPRLSNCASWSSPMCYRLGCCTSTKEGNPDVS